MDLLIVSFVAGILTVAAPCILPLLPIIVGGSLARSTNDQKQSKWIRPLIIASSLGLSVIAFTLLLKASTSLLGIPDYVWSIISGVIVILLGISLAFQSLWLKFAAKIHFESTANKLLATGTKNNNYTGDVITGLALGPVFNSCSPTYLLIVATVLPLSFIDGFTNLLAYAIGLSGTLLLVSYFGQSIISKLNWFGSNKNLQRIVGVLFIIVGLAVIFGLDKSLQSYVLENGWYDPISNLEKSLK